MSIDPGVRSFLTMYHADSGAITEWGRGSIARVYRLQKHIDKLLSKVALLAKDSSKKRNRWRLRRAITRVRDKVYNMVQDVHKKAARWLLDNHDAVVLPWFGASGMVKGQTISRETKRKLLSWRHADFRKRLLNLQREYIGKCKVLICNEEFTTQACTQCGALWRDIKAAKTYSCRWCALQHGRDMNASRNILLRLLALGRQDLY